MNKKAVEDVSIRSGLSVAVVTTLLNSGYAYLETTNPPTWVKTN